MNQLEDNSPTARDLFFIQRLEKVVDFLFKQDIAEPFREPVDWKTMGLPDYPKIVHYPMDLGTIKARLMNGEYRTMYDVLFDIAAIWKACRLFNAPDREVYKYAMKLQEMCNRQIDKIYDDYFELNKEASNKIKDQVTSRLMNLDSQRFSVIASWLMSECPESVAETSSGLVFDLDYLPGKEFDHLCQFLGIKL